MRTATVRRPSPPRGTPVLESFGSDDAQADRAKPPGIAPADHARAVAKAAAEGHARGYEEGAAAALAQAESDLAMLLGHLCEILSDQAVTGRAARAAAERALAPLVAACLTAIAPGLAQSSLAGAVLDHLATILARAPASRIRIYLNPQMLGSLEEAFAARGLDAGQVDLLPDPDCPLVTARIGWAEGYDEVSPGAAAEALAERLAPLLAVGAEAVSEPAQTPDRTATSEPQAARAAQG